jgi:hypothetical protein
VFLFNSRLLPARLLGGYVAIDDLFHVVGHLLLPGQSLEQSIPLRNQISIIDAGYLRANLADDFSKVSDCL